jgi:two-component system sensor histidine kinase KdpD
VTAAAAAGAWLVVERWEDPSIGLDVAVLNAAMRFLLLCVIVLLLALVRDALLGQRNVARVETEAAERLRTLNALKDTLLHAVSHDLRSPIAAIRGSVNTLSRADKLGLTTEQREGLIEAIAVSAGKLDHIVSDLLDLERLDRGVVEPDREPVDLSTVVERVVREGALPPDHPVRVEADPILVEVDRAKVERIVDNLIGNAIKHTPPGTPITVRVRYDDDGALLSVEDEGPGIPTDLKPVIFEPFRQGVGASDRGGVGIGLSLVKRFAQLHGGDAWVEDRPQGGTAFRVFLPGVISAQPRVVPRSTTEPAAGEPGPDADDAAVRSPAPEPGDEDRPPAAAGAEMA